jgi:hypothetical protein
MFKIPSTVEEAGAKLADLDGLITARSWQRAAIVYAFTHEGRGGRGTAGNVSETGQVSMAAFARLGIQGLRRRETVAIYRGHWQYAIDQGKAQPVRPGDRVEQPDLDFPPNPLSAGGTTRSATSLPVEQKRELLTELADDTEVTADAGTRLKVHEALVRGRRASRPDRPEPIIDEFSEINAAFDRDNLPSIVAEHSWALVKILEKVPEWTKRFGTRVLYEGGEPLGVLMAGTLVEEADRVAHAFEIAKGDIGSEVESFLADITEGR